MQTIKKWITVGLIALLPVGAFPTEKMKPEDALIKFDDLKKYGTVPQALQQIGPKYPGLIGA